ncbi:MAG: type II toxin-antitoxin system RelE/ParE family toxin [Deltaproteobacteria bacterium]|nr:type II toxin-antitoxin system RelE/ParE family toxin [Deltaproteobacteria bacterium]
MSYRLIIERQAEKEASKIPPHLRDGIDRAILSLAQEPRRHGCRKLTDKEGYRIRVGDYRILYSIDDKANIVVVYRIITLASK